MTNDQDAGLIKRGMVLLIVMLLLVSVVLFILFQGRHPAGPTPLAEAEDHAFAMAIPGTAFPANISWGSLYGLSRQLPSPVGWEIRHNAWATLARRGSDHVPWRRFPEMLDLERTTVDVRAQLPDAQEAPEPTARAMVIAALKAVADWHTVRRAANKTDIPDGLPVVYEAVDHLAQSPIPEIREHAEKTRSTFFRG
jgi:hypothetical protein